jgi:hypothetical protein
MVTAGQVTAPNHEPFRDLTGEPGYRRLVLRPEELEWQTVRWARKLAGRALPFGDVLWTLWKEFGDADTVRSVAQALAWSAWAGPAVLVTAEGGLWMLVAQRSEVADWEPLDDPEWLRVLHRRLIQRGWGLEGARRGQGSRHGFDMYQAFAQLQVMERAAKEHLLRTDGATLFSDLDRATLAVIEGERVGDRMDPLFRTYWDAEMALTRCLVGIAEALPSPEVLYMASPEAQGHSSSWTAPRIFRRTDLAAVARRNGRVARGVARGVASGARGRDQVGARATQLAAQQAGRHRFVAEMPLPAGSPRIEMLSARCVRDGQAVRILCNRGRGYLYTFLKKGEDADAARVRQLDFIYETQGLDGLWAAVTRAAARDPESVRLGRCAWLARRLPEIRGRHAPWVVEALDMAAGQAEAAIGGQEYQLLSPGDRPGQMSMADRERRAQIRLYVDDVMACAVAGAADGGIRGLYERLRSSGGECQPGFSEVTVEKRADEAQGQVTLQVELGLEACFRGSDTPRLASDGQCGWQALEGGRPRGPLYVAVADDLDDGHVALLETEVAFWELGGARMVVPWPVGPTCCAPWLGLLTDQRLSWLHRTDPETHLQLPGMALSFPPLRGGWVDVQPLGLLWVKEGPDRLPDARWGSAWCLLLGVGRRGMMWDVFRGGGFCAWVSLARQVGRGGQLRRSGGPDDEGGLDADVEGVVAERLPLLLRAAVGRAARL